MKNTLLCLLLLACLSAGPAKAEDAVPAWLVEAIIRRESGGNPYALNVAGKPLYPATRDEALRIITAALQDGQSFDVGLMQVNRWWMERCGITPEALLDPVRNRAWGEWILAQEIARHGLNWRAVGRYHSPDEERGRQYAWKIYAASGLGGGDKSADIRQENAHADEKTGRHNLHDAGGVWRRAGQRPAGRVIAFPLSPAGQPGAAGEKP